MVIRMVLNMKLVNTRSETISSERIFRTPSQPCTKRPRSPAPPRDFIEQDRTEI